MTVMIKKILGYILLGKSGITNVQLDAAFSDPGIADSLRQKIMSQKGALLAERSMPLAAALRLTSGVRQPIGNMLVESELITRGQLERALEVQSNTGERIGAIFSRLGMVETSSLDEALRSQQEQQQTIPVQAAFKIGEILVAGGHITSEQLSESLEFQKQSNKKLGEILVEKGYVAQHHVEHGIRLQQILVTAALGTVMSISSMNAAASPSGENSTATIQATAFVKPIARAKMLYQQPQLEITSQHIAQGYIDVSRASRIELRNNSHSGFVLTIENQGEPFSDVYVNGLENQIQLHSGTAWVLMPFTPVSKTFELSYRFVFSANAKAGSYPWPLQITATMM